ncbi:MAG: glycerophosphodiester phosphodiesterase family protein [Pleomorphochaeta sp.]
MRINKNNEKIVKSCIENNFLIAAHRGTVGGNIIPNTSLSFKNALLHGADIVEMDLILSSDNIFYVFHNGEEKKVLGIEKDIRKMSSKEIDELNCYNSLFLKTSKKLERAEDVLKKLEGKCFINIDRSWFYWKEIIQFVDSLNMGSQIMIKSPVEKELLDILEQSNSNVMYMPIIKNIKELEIVKRYNINLAAVELIFESLDSDLLNKQIINELHNQSILIWANAITLDNTIVLSGFLDDDISIEKGFDAGWGKLLEYGFNIIQTDWPALLKNYRDNIKNKN